MPLALLACGLAVPLPLGFSSSSLELSEELLLWAAAAFFTEAGLEGVLPPTAFVLAGGLGVFSSSSLLELSESELLSQPEEPVWQAEMVLL